MTTLLLSLFGLLKNVPGMVGKYFERKQEIQIIKWETEKQLAIEKQKLSAKLAEAEYKRAEASLQATGRWFKYLTFVIWFGPFIATIAYPPLGQQIFSNMSIMPAWYLESIMLIMFTIWGISTSAPVVVGIFSGIKQFFSERRADKIQMKEVDKKAMFEAIREIQGWVSQQQVKVLDPAMDKYNESKK